MIAEVCISLGENCFVCWKNDSVVDNVFRMNLKRLGISEVNSFISLDLIWVTFEMKTLSK